MSKQKSNTRQSEYKKKPTKGYCCEYEDGPEKKFRKRLKKFFNVQERQKNKKEIEDEI